MASFFGHFLVLFLYFAFPKTFDPVALIVGSQIIDFEYAPVFIYHYFFQKKKLDKCYIESGPRKGLGHSLIGALVIFFPISIIISYIISRMLGFRYILTAAILSCLVGIISHLILDIPAHKNQFIFYPFKVWEKNPLRCGISLPFAKKIYPFRKVETSPYSELPEWNWIIITTIITIAMFSIYFLITRIP
jgi:hypothetical protein